MCFLLLSLLCFCDSLYNLHKNKAAYNAELPRIFTSPLEQFHILQVFPLGVSSYFITNVTLVSIIVSIFISRNYFFVEKKEILVLNSYTEEVIRKLIGMSAQLVSDALKDTSEIYFPIINFLMSFSIFIGVNGLKGTSLPLLKSFLKTHYPHFKSINVL